MNTKTQTVVTEGYPEVGPFESEEAARAAALRPQDESFAAWATILSVHRRTGGWYKVYAISTTSTVYPTILDATRWKIKIRYLTKLPFYSFEWCWIRSPRTFLKRGIQITLFGYVFNFEWRRDVIEDMHSGSHMVQSTTTRWRE